MKEYRKIIPLIYLSSLLLCFVLHSCGEEESIDGSYLEIESGYKNCDPGLFRNQIEVLSDRGICWRANTLYDCRENILTLTPELAFMKTSSGIIYYDDGTQEEGYQTESLGTYTYEGNVINLYEDTRFGIDTTVLRIELDGTLNTVNETLLNCELHSIYRKQ